MSLCVSKRLVDTWHHIYAQSEPLRLRLISMQYVFLGGAPKPPHLMGGSTLHKQCCLYHPLQHKLNQILMLNANPITPR